MVSVKCVHPPLPHNTHTHTPSHTCLFPSLHVVIGMVLGLVSLNDFRKLPSSEEKKWRKEKESQKMKEGAHLQVADASYFAYLSLLLSPSSPFVSTWEDLNKSIKHEISEIEKQCMKCIFHRTLPAHANTQFFPFSFFSPLFNVLSVINTGTV